MKKVMEFRNKYPNFIYEDFKVDYLNDDILITYYFEIEGLKKFKPTLSIPREIIKVDINKKFLNELVFNLGMVEAISYYKATLSPNIIVKAGYLNDEQIIFFKKLIINGLGEFLYTNNININPEDLFKIIIDSKKDEEINIDYYGYGNLIPVGGGKDSCVTLELLKNMDNTCFVINPKSANKKCVDISENPYIYVNRVIDKNLIELNRQGFLNGHTPFSAIVAFTSYIVAYLSNKRYIVLSNEGSANEETVIGTNINHQYSKTYEFEIDFNNYTKNNFKINIDYFSFLRPLAEIQIAKIFSKYKKYHNVFKSCNKGSKNDSWDWCCNCAKCLFVFIILSPYLSKEELTNIFGEDLYEREDLLELFIEILGYTNIKPFECVGTYSEARYAVSLAINNYKKLPYLLKYFKENYKTENKLDVNYNDENNLPDEFDEILRDEMKFYDRKNY